MIDRDAAVRPNAPVHVVVRAEVRRSVRDVDTALDRVDARGDREVAREDVDVGIVAVVAVHREVVRERRARVREDRTLESAKMGFNTTKDSIVRCVVPLAVPRATIFTERG